MGSLEQNITPSCPSNYTGGVRDGKPCVVNITDFGFPSIENIYSASVLAAHLNKLREAINDEENRRQGNVSAFGSSAGSSQAVQASHWIKIKDAMDTLEAWTNTFPGSKSGYKSFSWSYTPAAGDSISGAFLHDAKNKINDAENDCLCNCNYCTCNCNYCTCNCNYCTCNCNYCTCDCNYSCTCDCDYTCSCNCNYSTCDCNYTGCDGAYSDVFLKKNVTYI